MGAVVGIRASSAALGSMPDLAPIYGALLPYSRAPVGPPLVTSSISLYRDATLPMLVRRQLQIQQAEGGESKENKAGDGDGEGRKDRV